MAGAKLFYMLMYWACPIVSAWVLWELRWKIESEWARMGAFFGMSFLLVGLLALAGVPYPMRNE